MIIFTEAPKRAFQFLCVCMIPSWLKNIGVYKLCKGLFFNMLCLINFKVAVILIL